MKRIACLNTLSTPSDDLKTSAQLMDIFNSTRLYNKKYQIQGIVLVSNNTLLQILEGESNILAESIYQLNQDKRIEDVSVILNTDIEYPLFKNWRIKFIDAYSERNNQYLQNIKIKIGQKLQVKSIKDKQRLAHFFSFESSTMRSLSNKDNPKVDQSTHHFSGYYLSLIAWPKRRQLTLTTDLLKVCSYLSQKDRAYEDVLNKSICPSKHALDHHLQNLYDLKLLAMKKQTGHREADDINFKNNIPEINKSTPNRFSYVLKKFITSAKTIR